MVGRRSCRSECKNAPVPSEVSTICTASAATPMPWGGGVFVILRLVQGKEATVHGVRGAGLCVVREWASPLLAYISPPSIQVQAHADSSERRACCFLQVSLVEKVPFLPTISGRKGKLKSTAVMVL